MGLNFHEKLSEHFIEIMLQIQGQNTVVYWTSSIPSAAVLQQSAGLKVKGEHPVSENEHW